MMLQVGARVRRSLRRARGRVVTFPVTGTPSADQTKREMALAPQMLVPSSLPTEVRLPFDEKTIPMWYANNFEVGHNAFEFVIDFGQVLDEGGSETWHGRVVSGPLAAKVLNDLLRRAVEDYERAF